MLFQIQDAFATEPLIPAVDEIVIPSETEAVEDEIEDNLIEQSEDIKFSEPETHLVTEGKNTIFNLGTGTYIYFKGNLISESIFTLVQLPTKGAKSLQFPALKSKQLSSGD